MLQPGSDVCDPQPVEPLAAGGAILVVGAADITLDAIIVLAARGTCFFCQSAAQGAWARREGCEVHLGGLGEGPDAEG